MLIPYSYCHLLESFHARPRDELFNREIFFSVFEAKVLYFDCRDVYNNFRPHSSIGFLGGADIRGAAPRSAAIASVAAAMIASKPVSAMCREVATR
jgi:hypothetical protein